MAKTFLRSGGLLDIYALGEQGRPVYASALEIRETLRLRQRPRIADCLAIPQPNEDGDRIDWYSPRAGKVSSWAGASDAERASALAELEGCQAAAAGLCQRAAAAEKPSLRLFGALLSKAMRFPDQHYVYLVGGKPVLTFWGFVGTDKKTDADAFASLRPPVDNTVLDPALVTDLARDVDRASPRIAATAPVENAPAAAAAAPALSWRRMWWIPPALALLAILALQIRGCVSRPPPVLSASALTALEAEKRALPAASPLTDAPRPPLEKQFSSAGNGGLRASDAANPADKALSLDAAAAQPKPADGAATQPTALAIGPADAGDGRNRASAPAIAPLPDVQAAPLPAAAAPEALVPAVAPAAISKNALVLPPETVKIGSTDFLNGGWRATVDIKEPLTGKPPSLKYQLNHGKGTVKITHGDGVTCRTAVDAGLMKSGNLIINSRAKARCSDGTRYQMPEIVCRQGAKGVAECKGRYDANTAFPITMKRESE
ncbi:SrfA family protein [Sodalis sp. RH20]|uniref:SrfA family protein n=1 Tax=unclassified Sodalis (in: enterobacteria) TaxID=2636512 RepID=UPI0039B67DA6